MENANDGFVKVEQPSSPGFQWTKAGEIVEGKLKAVTVDTTYNNKRYVIETNKGEISFFGSSVLNNRLQHVIIGDLVRIVYKGEMKSKQGRLFRDFDVFTKKTGPVPGEEVVK